ncbi:hypothetical protein GE115_17110 [Agromyces sp. CFH 90414]|uniref:Uncharacterized protein n=1 Tax=Agromyces agglutinans TaxID=2662258 RepID=A0A6I2FFX7_9MICO|nr:hypothetical protein [Agromyces agglutinans]MRG61580.1 hypothetical protein [Agromyces agglutinans]
MSDVDASPSVTVGDASADAAPRAPFAMISGDPAAMVCEGDVCFIPAADSSPTRAR